MSIESDLDAIAAETGFSGVVRVDGPAAGAARAGVRARPPRLRNRERARHAHRDRERHQGLDGARGGEPDRGRHPRARNDRALAARLRPAADRGRGHRRAPAGPPLGDRRLPGRGRGAGARRLRDASPGARARHDRAVPRRPRRAADEVRSRRAVLVLERRLRRACVARRARERRAVPRPGREPRLPARRDARHRVPPLGRPPRPHRARVRGGRRCLAVECVPPAGAGNRRRRRLHDRGRHQRALAGASSPAEIVPQRGSRG